MRIALMGLKFVVDHSMQLRRVSKAAKTHNMYRLKSKGIKGLLLNKINRDKYEEMKSVAKKVYVFNLQKLAIREMKKYKMNRIQYGKLKKCALNYYNLSLLKNTMDVLKKFLILSNGKSQQKYFVDAFYQKKLKTKFMAFLFETNFEFLTHASNVIQLSDRLYARKMLNGMRQNYHKSIIARVPKQSTFFYYGF